MARERVLTFEFRYEKRQRDPNPNGIFYSAFISDLENGEERAPPSELLKERRQCYLNPDVVACCATIRA